MLETDALLKEWGAILSPKGDDGKFHPCHSLCKQIFMPMLEVYTQLCHDRLELLILKWAVTVKFHDHMLGMKNDVYKQ